MTALHITDRAREAYQERREKERRQLEEQAAMKYRKKEQDLDRLLGRTGILEDVDGAEITTRPGTDEPWVDFEDFALVLHEDPHSSFRSVTLAAIRPCPECSGFLRSFDISTLADLGAFLERASVAPHEHWYEGEPDEPEDGPPPLDIPEALLPLCEAVGQILLEAPAEEPALEVWYGNTEEAQRWGAEKERWRIAQLLQEALDVGDVRVRLRFDP